MSTLECFLCLVMGVKFLCSLHRVLVVYKQNFQNKKPEGAGKCMILECVGALWRGDLDCFQDGGEWSEADVSAVL